MPLELFGVEIRVLMPAAAALRVPDQTGAIAEIGPRYDIEFLGPNPLAEAG